MTAVTLLACDNCIPGDQSHLYPLLLAAVLTGLLLSGLCFLGTRGRRVPIRVLGAVAAGAWIVSGPGAVLVVETPMMFGSVTCGSALSASLERGIPHDNALDESQRGCKHTGERRVVVAEIVALVAAAVGVGSTTAAFGAARRDCRRSHRLATA